MDIRVTVDSQFDLSDIDIDEIVQAELTKTAYKIEANAKRNCPIDTGNLRRSITTDIGDMEVDVGSNCEYASYVHDGTYKMAARPFLEEAADTEIDGLADRIAEAIERLL